MESVVYADSPVEEILRDSGVAVEEIAAVEGGDLEGESDAVASDMASETLYLPGSFHIDTANIQFSLISSYLLSDAIESRRSDNDAISSVYSTYSVYIQLSLLSVALLSAPIAFLATALALSAISTLTTSSARTQSLAYLQLTQALCEQSDARITALLTTHRLTTHTKIHIYDAMRRLQDAYTDAARGLQALVDDREHKALQAMYVRGRDGMNAPATRDAHSYSKSKALAHQSWSPAIAPHTTHTHRRNHTWPSPIPVPNATASTSNSASTTTTPRTSPTITYIQSPVNRSSRARRSGGSVSSVGSRRSTMNGAVENGGAKGSTSVGSVPAPVHSLAPLPQGTGGAGAPGAPGTQGTPGTRARARSYIQPIQAPPSNAQSNAHPDKSIRQRAVSQQHLRLPSLLRTNNAPAPILMRNSFGTPIGHISPTPSPTPSRKASLAGVDVEREVERDEEGEDTSTSNPGDSLGLKKNADEPVEQVRDEKADMTTEQASQTSQTQQTSQTIQTSPTPSTNTTIKPSDISQRRSKPIISKTRLWDLRQEVHDTRKPAIVAIIALKYACKADVYWKSVRGVVRELARSLRRVDGELSGAVGVDSGVEGVGGVASRKSDELSTHTHTTLRHLEHAYDVLFECYALNQYTRYADAHTHLSDALKAYSVGVAVGAGSGTDMGMAGSTRRRRKERDVPSEELSAVRAVDGIDAQTTADSQKTHYQDNDNEKTQGSAQDDVTAYLLDQTSADSLPRRGRRCDEAVFDGDKVENDADDEDADVDADVFAAPDLPDREARLAGKEVLDELMGLLRGEDGVGDEETRSARAVSPTPLPPPPPPPPQPQWTRRSDVGDIPQDAHGVHDRGADADTNADKGTDSDTDVFNDDHSPQAAREAAQRALKSIVF